MNEEFLLIVESLEKYKDLLENKNDEICDGMTEGEKRAYQLGITNMYEMLKQITEHDRNEENKIESSTEDTMKVIVDNADKLSHEADTEGITGYMYGCAVSILSQCWKYGEYLRKWHNKEYNYDGDGVVNPAILTIG